MEVVHDGSVEAHEDDEIIEERTALAHIQRDVAGLVDTHIKELRQLISVVGVEIIRMQR